MTHNCVFIVLFLFLDAGEIKKGGKMEKSCLIITNNPLVFENLKDRCILIYKDIPFADILKEVRDKIHVGYELLSHPLSGNVKPNETPYKSVMVRERKGEVDSRSLQLIENAIQTCEKFSYRCDKYKAEILKDFQLIDWTLLESAIASMEGS